MGSATREPPLVRVTLIVLTSLLGISFAALFVRWALPAPPIVTGFYRMLFASGVLAAFFLVTRRPVALRGRAALYAAASGLCFGTDLALWHTAIVHTSVAVAPLLVNTTPVYVGLYVLVVRRQSLDRHFILGAGLALLGTATLLGVPTQNLDDLTGAALALAAALFYTAYLLLMRAAREAGIDTLSALALMTFSATAVLGAYGLVAGDAFRGFPTSSWAEMAGAAVLTQIGGVMGIIWALRFLPATLASVALLGQPVGTALLGWWLLGEVLGWAQLLGGATVLAGIAMASRSATRGD